MFLWLFCIYKIKKKAYEKNFIIFKFNFNFINWN